MSGRNVKRITSVRAISIILLIIPEISVQQYEWVKSSFRLSVDDNCEHFQRIFNQNMQYLIFREANYENYVE